LCPTTRQTQNTKTRQKQNKTECLTLFKVLGGVGNGAKVLMSGLDFERLVLSGKKTKGRGLFVLF
jgi:hypothetical protein